MVSVNVLHVSIIVMCMTSCLPRLGSYFGPFVKDGCLGVTVSSLGLCRRRLIGGSWRALVLRRDLVWVHRGVAFLSLFDDIVLFFLFLENIARIHPLSWLNTACPLQTASRLIHDCFLFLSFFSSRVFFFSSCLTCAVAIYHLAKPLPWLHIEHSPNSCPIFSVHTGNPFLLVFQVCVRVPWSWKTWRLTRRK